MDISALFKKENVYKAITLAIVLIFIFSSFSVGFFQPDSGNASGSNASGTGEAEVVLNATIAGYQPYIIADANQSELEGVEALPGVEDVMFTSQGAVISLTSSDYMAGVYAYLQSRNITGLANAIISLPSTIELATASGSFNISGSDIGARIEPLYAEGETVSIRIYLIARGGRLTAYSNMNILPSLSEFARNATVVALADTETSIMVPWERRVEVAGELANLSVKYGADKVSYSKKDFVIGNVSGTAPEYATLVAGDTVYVGNYTDAEQIKTDIPGAVFPESVLRIRANASEFENLSRTYAYLYNVRIDEAGKQIFTALESSELYAPNETVEVIISAYAIKGRIISVDSAREAQ